MIEVCCFSFSKLFPRSTWRSLVRKFYIIQVNVITYPLLFLSVYLVTPPFSLPLLNITIPRNFELGGKKERNESIVVKCFSLSRNEDHPGRRQSEKRRFLVDDGASTERNTGKDKVGLVNAGGRKKGRKTRIYTSRVSSPSIIFRRVSCHQAFPVGRQHPPLPSSPVYGRNKREKYYRPFVSSRIVKVGQKLLWISRVPRAVEEEQRGGTKNSDGKVEIARQGLREGQIENSFIYEGDDRSLDRTERVNFRPMDYSSKLNIRDF